MTDPFDKLRLIWLSKEQPEHTDHIARLIDIDFYLFKYLKLKGMIEGDERDLDFWESRSRNQFHDYVKMIHKGT